MFMKSANRTTPTSLIVGITPDVFRSDDLLSRCLLVIKGLDTHENGDSR